MKCNLLTKPFHFCVKLLLFSERAFFFNLTWHNKKYPDFARRKLNEERVQSRILEGCQEKIPPEKSPP